MTGTTRRGSARHRAAITVAAAVFAAGCIEHVGPGPELGACAEIPDGVYGYGEAGIGTCLSGPADLRFFEQDGGTFLAVTNADPFREFRGGSVLLLDWSEIVGRLTDPLAPAPDQIRMDELDESRALEILDDDDGDGEGDNPFLGGFGYVPSLQAAVVASRLTENGVLRAGIDDAFVVDLHDMELPGGALRVVQDVELEDDPYFVVVDDPTQRVYVGNLTDHSVSVLSTRGDLADPDALVTEIDVAPGASATEAPFADEDASGSLAEISELSVVDGAEIAEDAWTLTYVDGTVRVWVPTDNGDALDSLLTWSTGDTVTYLPSAFGPATGLGEVRDPFVELDTTGLPVMYFARSSIGDIFRAVSGYYDGEWVTEATPVLTGGILGSPSVAPLSGEVGLYVDRRDAVEDPATISLAGSLDGATFLDEGDVLVPPVGVSYEDPYVAFDPLANRYRMWLTVRTIDGGGAGIDRFDVALSRSDDGRVWSEPAVVIPDAAAPSVAILEGRYGLWYTAAGTDDLGQPAWVHRFASSYDGEHWSAGLDAIPGGLPYDPLDPPRVAVLADTFGSWRLEGVDQGLVTGTLDAGVPAIELTNLWFELALTSGHEVVNDIVPERAADLGMTPGGTAIDPAGIALLYVTTIGATQGTGIAVLEPSGSDGSPFLVAVAPDALNAALGIRAGESASDPVVFADDVGYVMFFTLTASESGPVLARSTSDDGRTWTAADRAQVIAGEPTFDNAGQRAHSVEAMAEGGYRLWYTGDDGSVLRIGAATSDDLRGTFTREGGLSTDWRLGTGAPGSFDDSWVQDPLVVTVNGETHLYYVGYDGTEWHIGHALVVGNAIVRRTELGSVTSLASMSPKTRSFASAGVANPVLDRVDDDGVHLFYAGYDGTTQRIGRAIAPAAALDEVYAVQRYPTAGDRLSFATTRGTAGADVIELGQLTDEVVTLGYGMSGMSLDTDRGFLYVTTKLDDTLFVLDVRDDTDGAFVDANALDLEAVVQIDTGNALAGFRDVVVARSRNVAVLSGKQPDSLVFVDLTEIPDDDRKDLLTSTAAAVLPLQSAGTDAGAETFASFGGATMALTPDERLLLVPHFRGNGVSVFDLGMGAWATEIAWIPNIGENPHVVRVSPDGRWAVVANYLGEVVEETVSSNLAVIDLDPDSPTYLEAVTWLVN